MNNLDFVQHAQATQLVRLTHKSHFQVQAMMAQSCICCSCLNICSLQKILNVWSYFMSNYSQNTMRICAKGIIIYFALSSFVVSQVLQHFQLSQYYEIACMHQIAMSKSWLCKKNVKSHVVTNVRLVQFSITLVWRRHFFVFKKNRIRKIL